MRRSLIIMAALGWSLGLSTCVLLAAPASRPWSLLHWACCAALVGFTLRLLERRELDQRKRVVGQVYWSMGFLGRLRDSELHPVPGDRGALDPTDCTDCYHLRSEVGLFVLLCPKHRRGRSEAPGEAPAKPEAPHG